MVAMPGPITASRDAIVDGVLANRAPAASLRWSFSSSTSLFERMTGTASQEDIKPGSIKEFRTIEEALKEYNKGHLIPNEKGGFVRVWVRDAGFQDPVLRNRRVQFDDITRNNAIRILNAYGIQPSKNVISKVNPKAGSPFLSAPSALLQLRKLRDKREAKAIKSQKAFGRARGLKR